MSFVFENSLIQVGNILILDNIFIDILLYFLKLAFNHLIYIDSLVCEFVLIRTSSFEVNKCS